MIGLPAASCLLPAAILSEQTITAHFKLLLPSFLNSVLPQLFHSNFIEPISICLLLIASIVSCCETFTIAVAIALRRLFVLCVMSTIRIYFPLMRFILSTGSYGKNFLSPHRQFRFNSFNNFIACFYRPLAMRR